MYINFFYYQLYLTPIIVCKLMYVTQLLCEQFFNNIIIKILCKIYYILTTYFSLENTYLPT